MKVIEDNYQEFLRQEQERLNRLCVGKCLKCLSKVEFQFGEMTGFIPPTWTCPLCGNRNKNWDYKEEK